MRIVEQNAHVCIIGIKWEPGSLFFGWDGRSFEVWFLCSEKRTNAQYASGWNQTEVPDMLVVKGMKPTQLQCCSLEMHAVRCDLHQLRQSAQSKFFPKPKICQDCETPGNPFGPLGNYGLGDDWLVWRSSLRRLSAISSLRHYTFFWNGSWRNLFS